MTYRVEVRSERSSTSIAVPTSPKQAIEIVTERREEAIVVDRDPGQSVDVVLRRRSSSMPIYAPVGTSVVGAPQSSPQGVAPPGGEPDLLFDTGGTVLAFRVMTTSAAGNVIPCDAGEISHANKALGISLQSGLSGAQIKVRPFGLVSNSGWNWPPSAELFIGLNGELTTDQVGVFSQSAGYAVTPTTVFFNLGRAVVRS